MTHQHAKIGVNRFNSFKDIQQSFWVLRRLHQRRPWQPDHAWRKHPSDMPEIMVSKNGVFKFLLNLNPKKSSRTRWCTLSPPSRGHQRTCTSPDPTVQQLFATGQETQKLETGWSKTSSSRETVSQQLTTDPFYWHAYVENCWRTSWDRISQDTYITTSSLMLSTASTRGIPVKHNRSLQ